MLFVSGQSSNMAKVFVAYATPDRQVELELDWLSGETVGELIRRSEIFTQFPEIDLSINKVGLFSQLCELDDEPQAGDRVEIYRPLKIDPKESRRNRAKQL